MDPEADYKPFKVVEEYGLTILRLRGTKEQRPKVEADKVHIIMDAIAQGWDIDIMYADIEGDLGISEIADYLGEMKDGRPLVKERVHILYSEIYGDVELAEICFGRSVNFTGSCFDGNVNFNADCFNSDVYFTECSFRGGAYFNDCDFNGRSSFPRAVFDDKTYFIRASFGDNANFIGTAFSRGANFRGSTLTGNAYFCESSFDGYTDFFKARFSRNANFRGSYFSERANFRGCSFDENVDFGKVVMLYPASFDDVEFRSDTVFAGLWNTTVGRIEHLRWPVTDFSSFDTAIAIDASSNPYLKRYIEDEQWIQSWRRRSWWREPLFTIWELTSHCGRSIGLWAFWSVLIAVVFAFIYQAFGPESITFNVDKLRNFQPDLWDYLYYSVVTFTTLGFGDIVPLAKPARLAVGAEVVLGYVMLGGLISIFANKLARRS